MEYNFNEACFTYLYTKGRDERFSCHLPIGKLVLNYTKATTVKYASDDNSFIAIIGYCCDSHKEIQINDIPQYILDNKSSELEDLYNFCNRLAGRYVIILRIKDKEYIFGDATSSVQINYNTDGEICIASVDRLVAKELHYKESTVSLDIRKKALTDEQPLPYDATMYDNVKALLPNHYLDVNERKAYRVRINKDQQSNKEYILKRTSELISNIAFQYNQDFNIICPLTSGYDSRLVLSFMYGVNKHIPCYTTFLNHFQGDEPDLKIPRQICNELKLSYDIIKWNEVPEDYLNNVIEIVGDTYSKHTISEGYTNKISLNNKVIVNGHISDQIGKSLLGNSLPEFCATPSFFQCKVHNHSRYTSKLLKDYLNDQKKDDADRFDLLSWEIRCGRWASQGLMLYSVLGLNSMNIFNCREIILLWMQIPRKDRVNRIIHNYCLSQNGLCFPDIPFNPADKFAWVSNYCWLYYFATYIRHWIS